MEERSNETGKWWLSRTCGIQSRQMRDVSEAVHETPPGAYAEEDHESKF